MTPDLFTETLPPSDVTGRTPTLQEIIAWQARHDLKKKAVEEFEQDARDKAKVTP
jgi:hypothetical protein